MKGEKRAAPVFVIRYLLSTGKFDPDQLATLYGFLRYTLKANFRHFNDVYLKDCSVSSFDVSFKEEVLNNFTARAPVSSIKRCFNSQDAKFNSQENL